MSCDARKHYVYLHRREDSGEPFYVGLGSSERYARARTRARRNAFWLSVDAKHGRTVHIISDGLTRDEASAIELLTIFRLRRKGVRLTNLAHGGSIGPLGSKWSDERRAKMANIPPLTWSDEQKALHSKRMADKYADGKHPLKGIPRDPKYAVALAEARKGAGNPMWGRDFSTEHRAKISEAGKKRKGVSLVKLKRPKDMREHTFHHGEHGNWTGLQYDFVTFSGMTRQHVNGLVNGHRNKMRGWTYSGCDTHTKELGDGR